MSSNYLPEREALIEIYTEFHLKSPRLPQPFYEEVLTIIGKCDPKIWTEAERRFRKRDLEEKIFFKERELEELKDKLKNFD